MLKKISILIILLGTCILAQAQQVSGQDTLINQLDGNGLKQGIWIEKYADKASKGEYVNGLREGTWITRHEDGMLSQIASFKSGEKDGLTVEIDSRGYVFEEAFYENGLLDGTSVKYLRGGQKQQIINYKKGIYHGLKTVYYEHMPGKIMEETMYAEGQKHGISKWFDKEGNMIAQYNYFQGKLDGIQRTYYPQAKSQIEEEYHDGFPSGTHKEYFSNGNIKISGNYLDGKKEGKWQEFDENGKLIKETRFSGGIEK